MKTTAEKFSLIGILQIAKWADAYIENETGLPECPTEKLTAEEISGLALLGALLSCGASDGSHA